MQKSWIRFEWTKATRSFSFWLFWGVLLALSSLLFITFCQNYLQQAQTAMMSDSRLMGITAVSLKPYFGWCLLGLSLAAPIICAQSILSEWPDKTLSPWQHYPVTPWQYCLIKLSFLSSWMMLAVLVVCLPVLSLHLFVAIDLGHVLSASASIAFTLLFIITMSFWLTMLCRRWLSYCLLNYSLILTLVFIPNASFDPLLKFIFQEVSFLVHAYALMQGYLKMSDIFYFLITCSGFSVLGYLAARNRFASH